MKTLKSSKETPGFSPREEVINPTRTIVKKKKLYAGIYRLKDVNIEMYHNPHKNLYYGVLEDSSVEENTEISVVLEFQYVHLESDKRRLRARCNVIRESQIRVGVNYRGMGVAVGFYKWLLNDSTILISDDTHYEGAQWIWKSLVRSREIEIDVIDITVFGMVDNNINIHDIGEFYADLPDDKHEHLRFVGKSKSCI